MLHLCLIFNCYQDEGQIDTDTTDTSKFVRDKDLPGMVMIGPGGKLQNTNMKKVGGGTYISPSAFAQSGVGATTTMKLSEQGK